MVQALGVSGLGYVSEAASLLGEMWLPKLRV